MTIWHRCYGLDAKVAAAKIEEAAGGDTPPDFTGLRQAALDAVAGNLGQVKEIAPALRHDESWFDPAADTPPGRARWVSLLLAAHAITGPPNLGGGPTVHYDTLARGLPRIGWSESSSRDLVFGESLTTLFSRHGTYLTAPAVDSFPENIGWLPRDNIAKLMPRLDTPAEARQLPGFKDMDAALQAAKAMVSWALRADLDLLLILED